FDEVRDEVVRAWHDDQVQAALMERAEQVAEAIRGGSAFDEQGLETGTATGIRRDGIVEGLPGEAVETIFEMEPGEARAIPTQDGAAVVRLDSVTPADQEGPEAAAAKEGLAGQVEASMAEDILSAFVRAAEADAGI